ncbi:MAG: electron transfer flavoprotein subunit beta/FixA family protein [Candidatus Hodarchaeales archaeon]|jgi:electron transfer flavoprotein beta subunit
MVSILVLIKQVPLPKEMRTSEEGFMKRTGVKSMINPYCKHALEEALRFKAKVGGTITVLSMGPSSFEQSLKEALALGANEAYLLTDRKLAGSDTMATARALSLAIKKIGEFHIIFAGIQTIDGDTGHVGPQVAERLGYNQITYIDQLKPQKGSVIARRLVERGYELVEAPYPILVTVTQYANIPRAQTLKHAIRSRKYEIKHLNIANIGLRPEDAGIDGSPTIVSKVRKVKFERPPCEIIRGSPSESKIATLLEELLSPQHGIEGKSLE